MALQAQPDPPRAFPETHKHKKTSSDTVGNLRMVSRTHSQKLSNTKSLDLFSNALQSSLSSREARGVKRNMEKRVLTHLSIDRSSSKPRLNECAFLPSLRQCSQLRHGAGWDEGLCKGGGTKREDTRRCATLLGESCTYQHRPAGSLIG